MRMPSHRRRWIAVAAVLLLVASAIRLLDGASWIYYYRVVDERTLAVGTATGKGASTRVTSVVETPTTVTITVSSFLFQLGAGTDAGITVESIARLRDPIGNRSVIDGSSGKPVVRTRCPWPSYLAPGCT